MKAEREDITERSANSVQECKNRVRDNLIAEFENDQQNVWLGTVAGFSIISGGVDLALWVRGATPGTATKLFRWVIQGVKLAGHFTVGCWHAAIMTADVELSAESESGAILWRNANRMFMFHSTHDGPLESAKYLTGRLKAVPAGAKKAFVSTKQAGSKVFNLENYCIITTTSGKYFREGTSLPVRGFLKQLHTHQVLFLIWVTILRCMVISPT